MIDIQEKLPLYSVFILILILSGGYIVQLIPCSLQKVLINNIFIKHLFCYLTLLFLITIVDSSKDNIKLTEVRLDIFFHNNFLKYI